MYARIYQDRVAELIEDVQRQQFPAPDPFPEGYEPTADELSEFAERQALHDAYVPGVVPLAERFTPEFLEHVVAVPADLPVALGWIYADGQLSAPPEPEAQLVSVPFAVSRAQAKLELLAAGLLDDVEGFIAGMADGDRRRALIEWNERESFERQSPFLLQMAEALGWSDDQLDALFIGAAAR